MDNETIKDEICGEADEIKTSNENACTESSNCLKENVKPSVDGGSSDSDESSAIEDESSAIEDESSTIEDESSAVETVETNGKRFCVKCGAELLPDQRFCPKCGANQEIGIVNNTAVEEFNKQLSEKKKKKKKKLILIIVAIITIAGLGIGGKYAFTAIRHSTGISKADKALEGYKADEVDYETAIAEVAELKASKDADVASHATDTEKEIEKLKKSKDHFAKGKLYKEKKDYQNAINHYEAVIEEDPNYGTAQEAIKEIIPLWKKTIPSEIDALLKKNDTEDADKLIKTFLGYSPDDKDVSNIGKFIEAEEFYKKGYLNSAQDIYKTLPNDLKVNGITVKSRLDTLKKYSVFVKMCGKWKTTKYRYDVDDIYKRTGRNTGWYNDGDSANRYLTVTCVIKDNGKVTVSGTVEFACYTNYSTYTSSLDSKVFDSDFSKDVSLPSNGQVSISFVTYDFTRSNSTLTDNQKIVFNGNTFTHALNMTHNYSIYYYLRFKTNETFGTRVEKY